MARRTSLQARGPAQAPIEVTVLLVRTEAPGPRRRGMIFLNLALTLCNPHTRIINKASSHPTQEQRQLLPVRLQLPRSTAIRLPTLQRTGGLREIFTSLQAPEYLPAPVNYERPLEKGPSPRAVLSKSHPKVTQRAVVDPGIPPAVRIRAVSRGTSHRQQNPHLQCCQETRRYDPQARLRM